MTNRNNSGTILKRTLFFWQVPLKIMNKIQKRAGESRQSRMPDLLIFLLSNRWMNNGIGKRKSERFMLIFGKSNIRLNK
jgi:hypothetical protein